MSVFGKHHKDEPTSDVPSEELLPKTPMEQASTAIQQEVASAFDPAFREDLKTRGRQKFDELVEKTAMFLKQDLDVTVVELGEHLKDQTDKLLDTEFAKYAESMKKAQDSALKTLETTAKEIETQGKVLLDELHQEAQDRRAAYEQEAKDRAAAFAQETADRQAALQQAIDAKKQELAKSYETNMAQVIEHYVLQAFGDQLDLKSQLPLILKYMEEHKTEIIEDMTS